MMTSLMKTPLSKQAKSSLVTVMRPLQGGGGYWINLEVRREKVSRGGAALSRPLLDSVDEVRADLVESCCRPETLTMGFLHICWFLSGVPVSCKHHNDNRFSQDEDCMAK